MNRRSALPDLVGPAIWSVLLMLPGALAFQPAFGDMRGYLVGGLGVIGGVAVAVLSARLRWSVLPTLLALLAVYFLLGGPIALPGTTIADLPATMGRLSVLIVQSWRDLLTVTPPAGDFVGPAVVPWLAGLVLGCLVATTALRTRRSVPAALVALVWLGTGIAFGVRQVPAAVAVGALQGLTALGWLTWRQATTERDANQDLLVNQNSQRTATIRRLATAAAVLVAACSVSGFAVAATSDRVNRQVLRDHVAPPLNLADYPTPLAKYRLYETDLAEQELMTVTGLPKGARLRLATMDTYDGSVYNVSQVTSDYVRVGSRFGEPGPGTRAQVQITVGAYQGVWLPTVGTPHALAVDSPNASRQANGLYVNRVTGNALTTVSLTAQDRITVDADVPDQPTSTDDDRLRPLGAGPRAVPTATGVPEVLSPFASDVVAGAGTAFEQLEALEAALRQGYYSDGSDGISRSGHTTERLTSMFSGELLIGDDEQYATAMALMANQLGIPSRVVLGFYPPAGVETGGAWRVTGDQAHVWVEADLDQVGWVIFDPTPDRDRIPKTQVPQPQPKPRPLVDPPPNPPEQPQDEPLLDNHDVTEDDGDQSAIPWLGLALRVAAAVGAGGLLAAPFLIILWLKRRRRATRRTDAYVRGRFAAGWQDITDHARDLGVSQPGYLTRRECAGNLSVAFAEADLTVLAEELDRGTFSAHEPHSSEAEGVWLRVDQARAAMSRAVPWHRRVKGAVSVRSLARAPRPSVSRSGSRQRSGPPGGTQLVRRGKASRSRRKDTR